MVTMKKVKPITIQVIPLPGKVDRYKVVIGSKAYTNRGKGFTASEARDKI
jgi:hypothetical protein